MFNIISSLVPQLGVQLGSMILRNSPRLRKKIIDRLLPFKLASAKPVALKNYSWFYYLLVFIVFVVPLGIFLVYSGEVYKLIQGFFVKGFIFQSYIGTVPFSILLLIFLLFLVYFLVSAFASPPIKEYLGAKAIFDLLIFSGLLEPAKGKDWFFKSLQKITENYDAERYHILTRRKMRKFFLPYFVFFLVSSFFLFGNYVKVSEENIVIDSWNLNAKEYGWQDVQGAKLTGRGDGEAFEPEFILEFKNGETVNIWTTWPVNTSPDDLKMVLRLLKRKQIGVANDIFSGDTALKNQLMQERVKSVTEEHYRLFDSICSFLEAGDILWSVYDCEELD